MATLVTTLGTSCVQCDGLPFLEALFETLPRLVLILVMDEQASSCDTTYTLAFQRSGVVMVAAQIR